MKDFNEKCAEYLGWKYIDVEDYVETAEYEVYWWDITNKCIYNQKDLEFDSDWNWIMLVIEKILDNISEDYDFEPYYLIIEKIPNLEETKQAIYNYITNNENT